jgi:hypothetical protein
MHASVGSVLIAVSWIGVWDVHIMTDMHKPTAVIYFCDEWRRAHKLAIVEDDIL